MCFRNTRGYSADSWHDFLLPRQLPWASAGGCDMKSSVGREPVVVLHPELYRIRDAAAVLAVSERMIYALIETGALVATRLPSTGTKRAPVRIPRADLLAFVTRYREGSA